jgi:hypothetical protein
MHFASLFSVTLYCTLGTVRMQLFESIPANTQWRLNVGQLLAERGQWGPSAGCGPLADWPARDFAGSLGIVKWRLATGVPVWSFTGVLRAEPCSVRCAASSNPRTGLPLRARLHCALTRPPHRDYLDEQLLIISHSALITQFFCLHSRLSKTIVRFT